MSCYEAVLTLAAGIGFGTHQKVVWIPPQKRQADAQHLHMVTYRVSGQTICTRACIEAETGGAAPNKPAVVLAASDPASMLR
jgi:hypothetical protein